MSDKHDHFTKAFANPGTKVPLGRRVICDRCDKDWTDRTDAGGFIFCSSAYCPNCAGQMLTSIVRHKEEHFIRAEAKPGEAFADFVRRYRGPDAYVQVN